MAGIKITIEGLPKTGKTTLYNGLIKHYQTIIQVKSPDFVKNGEHKNYVVSKIEGILKSKDSKFLTLDSPIGETLLLLARIAFRADEKRNSTSKKIQISDKSVDTLISHAIPRLLRTGYFKTEEEAFRWITTILEPFYEYPDLTLFLMPRNLNNFLDKTSTDENERNYLEQISKTYDFLYSKTKFRKRTNIIHIYKDISEAKILSYSIKIIDKYLKNEH